MRRDINTKALSMLLIAFLALAMVPFLTHHVNAATEAQIEASGAAAVAYLASVQNPDGSWGWGGNEIAKTGLVLLKFLARANELHLDPFDNDPLSPRYYIYANNVIAGFNYLLSHAQDVDISVQTHGDPDTNLNGKGITFYGTVYYTGIALTTIAFSGHPDDRSAVIGSLGLRTYRQIAQDIADWLAFAQGDQGNDRGGYGYGALDNVEGWTDNSNSGYAYLGLAFAEDPPFSCTIPQWVKDELDIWIITIQDPVNGDTDDGGSYYNPDWLPWNPWVNVLKTGNLIFEMAFYGDSASTPRVQAAVDYLERHWRDANSDPGWGYSLPVASYQAKFLIEKGLTYMGINEIDTDGDGLKENWWNQEPPASPPDDFASVIVAQQLPSGGWPQTSWDYYPDAMLSTAWAVLTLERFAPPPEFNKRLNPEEGELGTVVHVTISLNVDEDQTVTVVDTLPPELSYISGTFAVNDIPATPTVDLTPPPPPRAQVITYTITEAGTFLVEFDAKVTMAYWEDRTITNKVTATWETVDETCHSHGNVNYPGSHFESTYVAMDFGIDTIVDDKDLTLAGYAFDKFIWEPWGVAPGMYNPDADFNEDGIVDLLDLALVAVNLGLSHSETKEATADFVIHPFEELHKNVGIPKADIVFAIDLTGSMTNEIAVVKAQAANIMNSLAAQIADVQFGLMSFMDYDGVYSTTAPGSVPLTYTATYGWAPAGDVPYRLDQDITSNTALVAAKIAGLVLGNGMDWAQDYARIIYESYSDTNLHWRTGAKKILILFGDAWTHDTNFDYNNDGTPDNAGGDPGRDTILGTADDLDFETVVANAAAAGVHVMAVYSGAAGQGDYEWQYMATQTSGGYFKLDDAGQIPDVIKDLIKKQAQETLTIKEKTEVQWAVVLDVTNPFSYTMKDVMIKDNFGAELEIDEVMTAPDTNFDGVVDILDLSRVSIDYGTIALLDQDRWNPVADVNRDGIVDVGDLSAVSISYGLTLWLTGKTDKVHLFWYIGDLPPGETARIIILVSTDLNPAGKQEYTTPGIYEMNSGATLKFIDPEQNMQLSAVTDSIYVTVLPAEDP